MSLNKFVKKFAGITEEHLLYSGKVKLLYDVNKHVYLLSNPDGLEELPSVSTVCHILDKSEVLIPWGCKVMENKLLGTIENFSVPDEHGGIHFNQDDLEKWIKEAKRAHKEHLEDAGNIGKIAHSHIEKSINAKLNPEKYRVIPALPVEEPRAMNAIIAAESFMLRHKVRWVATEFKVCSLQHKYAGTCDGRCIADSCDDPDCCPCFFKDKLCIIDWKSSNQLSLEYKLQVAAYRKAFHEEYSQYIEHAFIIRLGKTDGKFQTWHLTRDELQECWLAFEHALGLYKLIKKFKKKA